MKHNEIIPKDDKYFLNEEQSFIIDKDIVRKNLDSIQFPVLIMDTEFFNKSHDVENLDKKLYSDDTPDLIYTICYSIANSYKDLANRQNRKSISTLYVRRKFEDETFNFTKQMNKILKTLTNIIIHKGIKTLVFAGESNDVKILTSWINKNKKLLNNKVAPLFIKNKNNGQIDINTFDMYKALTQGFSFSNKNPDGTEFYNPKNLKKGNKGEQTIQLPSLKRFFDYFGDYFAKDNFEEKQDIYKLCCEALKFYTLDFDNVKDFNRYNNSIKLVKDHCHNDVLKLLYLIDFMYKFATLDDGANQYVKLEIGEEVE